MVLSNRKRIVVLNNKVKLLELFIVLLIGSVEFIMIYFKDLPPGLSYSILPRSVQTNMELSTYADSFSENNFAFLLSPITLVMTSTFNSSLVLYLTVILGFLSMYYFIKYISLKYMSVSNIYLLDLVGITVSSLYVNTFYFGGGKFFDYSLYYSLVPFILITLDKYFNTSARSNITLLKQSLVIALVLGIATLDIRTLVYNAFIFIYFLFFIIAYDHDIVKLKKSLFMTFFVALFYVLINIKFALIIFAESSTGVKVISSVVPAQIYIALQRYSLLYALAGAQTWYTVYNSGYIYLGLIPLFFGLTLILNLRMRKIFALLYIPLIIFIIFSTYGGNTILFYFAQTNLYPYLAIVYPYYVMGAMYDPFLYALFGLATFNVVNKIYTYLSGKHFFRGIKGKKIFVSRIIRIATVITVIFLILMPVEYYLEPQEKTENSSETVILPSYIKNITNTIYNSNLTGNIYLYGSITGQKTYFANIPNLIWSNYPASPTNVIQFIFSSQTKNLGNVLAYFGIQFIIYAYNGNASTLSYLNNQSSLNLITEQHDVLLFKNLHYVKSVEFSNELYVGFDMPYIFKYLNTDSHVIPIMPFYSIGNFSQISDYITGITGVNISVNMIIPLLLNQTNSYKIDVGSMAINNWPNGWGIAPDGGIGSDVNAIYPYSNAVLKLKENIPNGEYYVVVEGGSFRYGYGTSEAAIDVSSGNSNSTLFFNQTMFSPYVQYSNIQEISLNNGTIYLDPTEGTPFVSNIYFIPLDKYHPLLNAAHLFLNSHTILNVSNGRLTITNNTVKDRNENFTSSLIYTNEISPSGSYFNTLSVKNTLFHFTYNYGLGEGYITFGKPDVEIQNSSSISLLYVSVFIDSTLLSLLYIVRKYKDNY